MTGMKEGVSDALTSETPSSLATCTDLFLILFCIKSIASKGRPEGFQRAIGKPFGRARRRETSALGKAIVLSENSIKSYPYM